MYCGVKCGSGRLDAVFIVGTIVLLMFTTPTFTGRRKTCMVHSVRWMMYCGVKCGSGRLDAVFTVGTIVLLRLQSTACWRVLANRRAPLPPRSSRHLLLKGQVRTVPVPQEWVLPILFIAASIMRVIIFFTVHDKPTHTINAMLIEDDMGSRNKLGSWSLSPSYILVYMVAVSLLHTSVHGRSFAPSVWLSIDCVILTRSDCIFRIQHHPTIQNVIIIGFFTNAKTCEKVEGEDLSRLGVIPAMICDHRVTVLVAVSTSRLYFNSPRQGSLPDVDKQD
ncbi:hypothetical protein J6590_010990 [Homalodisca vitripennis]|nr:hypothetical protein J6590_010990 [Homalodisca vitripennis]